MKYLGSPRADRIIGSKAADEIRGFDGADYLVGGEGNDHIWAGKGHDVITGYSIEKGKSNKGEIDYLWGGYGSDRFMIGSAYRDDLDKGFAAIGDFSQEDRLVLAAGTKYLIQSVGGVTEVRVGFGELVARLYGFNINGAIVVSEGMGSTPSWVEFV